MILRILVLLAWGALLSSGCLCGVEGVDGGPGGQSRDAYHPDVTGMDLWFARDANIFNEGGLGIDVHGLDAGIAAYQGAPEPGVVCGDDPCAEGAACCVAAGLPPALSCDPSSACPGALVRLVCDGPEDCGPDHECCADPQYNTSCVPVGTCYGSPDAGYTNSVLICIDHSDCRMGFMCCSASLSAALGVDVGWCLSYCS